MIDLEPEYLSFIKTTLEKFLPGVEVKAFGSRVSGSAKQFSDLDLVLIDSKPISQEKLNELRFEFSNSHLPIMIDLVDWHRISEAFRNKIQLNWESLFRPLE